MIDNTSFYPGSGNTVTCFCCGLEMTLEFHEDVTEKHLQLSPNCELLRYEMQKMNDDAHRIRQQLLCKVCYANRVMITFRPCCHLATCEECADKLELCPICRTVIMEKIKTFLWAKQLQWKLLTFIELSKSIDNVAKRFFKAFITLIID